MCDKGGMLLLFFILKIIIFALVPILILLNKRISQDKMNKLFIVDAVLIVLFIVLRISNFTCVSNSTLNGLNISMKKNSTDFIKEKNDADSVNEIVTNKIYKTNSLSNVYYFNNNQLPLSNKKVICDNKELYMRQYGNGITAVSSMVSTILNKNVDPIAILELSIRNGIFDCEEGVNINLLLDVVSNEYNITFREIDSENLWNTVYSGKLVMEEIVYNKDSLDNITCDKGYILVYDVDNSYNFQILNPNNSIHDYICPDNTVGSMTKITGNTNSKTWNLTQLDSIKSRYIVGERN